MAPTKDCPFLAFTGSVAALLGLLQLFHTGTHYNLCLVGRWGPPEGMVMETLRDSAA
jgi:hypothetical protein